MKLIIIFIFASASAVAQQKHDHTFISHFRLKNCPVDSCEYNKYYIPRSVDSSAIYIQRYKGIWQPHSDSLRNRKPPCPAWFPPRWYPIGVSDTIAEKIKSIHIKPIQ